MLSGGKFAGIWSGGYRGDTEWSILSDMEWTVPVSGYYEIDIRGGGGGGGGCASQVNNGTHARGGSGGDSRQVETHFLTKGEVYPVTIGKGGEFVGTGQKGTNGGASSFGDLITIRGGDGGGYGGIQYVTNPGTNGTSYGNATPGSGEAGDGGLYSYYAYDSYYRYYYYVAGEDGLDGACYITYLGQGYARN